MAPPGLLPVASEGGGTRTLDPVIKSHMLYRLSYALTDGRTSTRLLVRPTSQPGYILRRLPQMAKESIPQRSTFPGKRTGRTAPPLSSQREEPVRSFPGDQRWVCGNGR
jgi:hypothetical protein